MNNAEAFIVNWFTSIYRKSYDLPLFKINYEAKKKGLFKEKPLLNTRNYML